MPNLRSTNGLRAASIAGCLGCWLVVAMHASGQQRPDPEWLTGDRFARQLDGDRHAIAWASQSLRRQLNNFSHYLHIAVWLDRRLDPSQEPEISLPDMTARNCFEALAAKLRCGVCYVGPVAYFGPPSVSSRLATVAALRTEELERLPPEVRQRLSRPQPWRWDELTSPRELLEQLSQQSGVRIVGIDELPHDLWAAGDLPPLNFAERLTLVLAGFDRTFEFDPRGTAVRFQPLPDHPTVTRRHAVEGDPTRWLGQLQSAVPDARLGREGARIVAVGRVEDQERISRLLRGEKVRAPATGTAKTVYTMKGPAALGTVLRTLQEKAGLKMDIDPSLEEQLKQRVDFNVRDASLGELLQAVFADTELRYEYTDQELRVTK